MAPERLLSNTPGAIRELGYAFQERAAIIEHCGGLARDEAERLAWREVNDGWTRLVVCGRDPDKHEAKGVTAHWLPPPPSYYGEAP